MLVLGEIEQEIWENYGHFGAILEINMAATKGREFLGSIFIIYRYYIEHLYKVSCFLQKLNDYDA